jgi:hypothetical protein
MNFCKVTIVVLLWWSASAWCADDTERLHDAVLHGSPTGENFVLAGALEPGVQRRLPSVRKLHDRGARTSDNSAHGAVVPLMLPSPAAILIGLICLALAGLAAVNSRKRWRSRAIVPYNQAADRAHREHL